MTDWLKQRLKARIREMPVVGEGAAEAEAALGVEGEMLDESRRSTMTAKVANPCLLPLFHAREDEPALFLQTSDQPCQMGARGEAGQGVGALGDDIRSGDEGGSFRMQRSKCAGGRNVPLIALISEGDESHTIEEDGSHR